MSILSFSSALRTVTSSSENAPAEHTECGNEDRWVRTENRFQKTNFCLQESSAIGFGPVQKSVRLKSFFTKLLVNFMFFI